MAARQKAIVAAFSLDERTVARWQLMSGHHCRRLHEHIIHPGGVLLEHVQAEELRIRIVGGVLWLASALSVSNRLWLGGVVQARRDRALRFACSLSECAPVAPSMPSCFAPMASAELPQEQALKVLREPLRTGKRGRPRLLLPEGLMVAQLIKRYARRRVLEAVREGR
jgi:hypothetical protein